MEWFQPMKRSLLFCVVGLVTAGCSSISNEPSNLQFKKQELIAYVESGEYDRQLGAVAQHASEWIERRAAGGGKKLAVVFDLDETLLRNWSQIQGDDFGYVSSRWNAWVGAAKAPAIDPVRETYRVARRRGVDVLFITGRPERQRSATEANLRELELTEFATLICKPDEDKGTTGAFKTAARQRLTSDGWVIIANIGDQESDLAGGYAERTFKLPNPFYITQ